MRHLPAPLRIYLLLVYSVAATAVGLIFLTLDRYPAPSLTALVVLATLAAFSDFLPLKYREDMAATPITAFMFASVLLLPPLGLLVVVLAGTIPSELALRKPWYRTSFNIAMRLIIYLLLSFWSPLLQFDHLRVAPVSVLIGIVSMVIAYMLLMTSMMSIVVALAYRQPITQTWRDAWFAMNFNDHSLAPFGLIFGWLWQIDPVYFGVGLVPLAAIYRAFRTQASLLVEQKATARLLRDQQEVQAATAALLRPDDLRSKLRAVLHHLGSVLPVAGAAVVLWGGEEQGDTVVRWGRSLGGLVDIHSPNIRQLCYAREIAQIQLDTTTDAHSGIVVPLAAEDEVVGGMFLLTDPAPLTDETRTLLETFAAQAALALAQSRLIEELKSSQVKLVQSERLSAIGQLAASVAHEFNNLLAGILGTAELALELGDRPSQVDALQAVVRVSQQGGSISRRLLAFSRQLEPHRELARLDEAVGSVLDIYQHEFKRSRVQLVRKIKPVPPTVCDVGLLSQVVLNLVLNALDAMHDKGGVLKVELGEEQGGICLSVADTGAGIPESIRNKLFEPFTSTKGQSVQKLHGGYGLGLSLVYGVVTDHQGRIDVESEVGQGTTMRVWLPIVEGEQMVVPPVDIAASTRLQAVVVDDEPLIAKAVHGMITTTGHEAEWFSDPAVALTWIRDHPVDILFVDLSMPDLDGLELVEAALEIHPNARAVVITAQVDPDQISRARMLGVTAVLEKPFSIKEIHGVLQTYQRVARTLAPPALTAHS